MKRLDKAERRLKDVEKQLEVLLKSNMNQRELISNLVDCVDELKDNAYETAKTLSAMCFVFERLLETYDNDK